MKTIVVAMRKGGTGKTTTTRNVAVALMKLGNKVLLIDTDSQGSLTTWWKQRQADELELLVVNYNQLPEAKVTAENTGYDFILIDTPPESNEVIEATIKIADFVLIPLKAGGDDLRAVGQTLKLVKELNKEFAFVLNEIKPTARITREIAETVSNLGPLAPSQISRTVHVEASIEGLTCVDYSMSSKASKEVIKLVDYIKVRLENTDENTTQP